MLMIVNESTRMLKSTLTDFCLSNTAIDGAWYVILAGYRRKAMTDVCLDAQDGAQLAQSECSQEVCAISSAGEPAYTPRFARYTRPFPGAYSEILKCVNDNNGLRVAYADL